MKVGCVESTLKIHRHLKAAAASKQALLTLPTKSRAPVLLDIPILKKNGNPGFYVKNHNFKIMA